MYPLVIIQQMLHLTLSTIQNVNTKEDLSLQGSGCHVYNINMDFFINCKQFPNQTLVLICHDRLFLTKTKLKAMVKLGQTHLFENFVSSNS